MLNKDRMNKLIIAAELKESAIGKKLQLTDENSIKLVDDYFDAIKDLVVSGNIVSLCVGIEIYPKYNRQLKVPVDVLGFKLYKYSRDSLTLSISSQVNPEHHIWDIKTKWDVIKDFAGKAPLVSSDATVVADLIRRRIKKTIEGGEGIYIMDFFTLFHDERDGVPKMPTRGHPPLKRLMVKLLNDSITELRQLSPLMEDRFGRG